MDPAHKENIRANTKRLLNVTDYENFIRCCIKKEIISNTMRENIENEWGNETDRKQALWEKIPKRGPKAYARLLELCSENYPVAYTILNKSTGKNLGQVASVSQTREVYTPLDEPDMKLVNDGACLSMEKELPSAIVLETYPGPVINHLNLTVKKSRKIHKNPKLNVYKMTSRNRGVLLLINIIKFRKAELNRRGADNDRDNLIYLFTELGFTIYYYEDIEPKKLFRYLEAFQMQAILEKYECFVFGIMTHGNIENHQTYVEFGNGQTIPLDSILEQFYNDKCYSLIRKPKIFLLPFCRGNHPDLGVFVQNIQHDGSLMIPSEAGQSSVRKITTKSDILICYATVKGYESHRHRDTGSWYIQALCQVWAENAHDTDVETMMKMVDTKMREEWGNTTHTVQTASMENLGFNDALFLNPGFYEE